jgi:hypothetical protein
MIKIKIWAWIDGTAIKEDVSAYFVILYLQQSKETIENYKKPRLG